MYVYIYIYIDSWACVESGTVFKQVKKLPDSRSEKCHFLSYASTVVPPVVVVVVAVVVVVVAVVVLVLEI